MGVATVSCSPLQTDRLGYNIPRVLSPSQVYARLAGSDGVCEICLAYETKALQHKQHISLLRSGYVDVEITIDNNVHGFIIPDEAPQSNF